VPSPEVNSIAIDPITPQNVYLVGPDGLFRSIDGGLTWGAMNAVLEAEPLALTLDPRNPGTLFVLLAGGAVLRSDDSGSVWATLEIGR